MENQNDRAGAFDAGATDLISKPLNPREFLGRVRVHLERGRLIKRLSDFRVLMSLELEQARATQELLLPTVNGLKQIEHDCPLLVASHYEASIGIGGDFWGVTALDGHKCSVFCIDFSGHGVGAALNTARLHSFMSREQSAMTEPASWLSRINRFLCEALPVGQYATMFGGVVDFADNSLTYAAASAPPPVALSAGDGRLFRLIDGTGYPLGIDWDSTYEACVVPFAPGSVLFLYSDALIETPSLIEPVFTSEALCDFLEARGRDMSPAEINNAVLQALRARTSEKPADDLTIVTLKHRRRE
jgi:phosphoserine phosphatase RsbU/P